MLTLTVSVDGQVTFREDVLAHLGIKPGGKLTLDLLPDGKASLEAEQPRQLWRRAYGMLQGKSNGVAMTIEDIDHAIADNAAKAGTAGLSNG